ncbi:D-2-hydroxyacid dehydrogenase [Lachnellula suecica]|uniref:D-2-hydroxyacid dehydrogenase n=1 Tax=Lachnellula suecica TaxID=602035 RepID=A0A8T9BWF0_9HELO|nr:D-2-hydroxyacid dehydrogenase [Lachnellula suecica]
MGEAPPPDKEHILCLIPLKVDPAILESIKKRHPNVDFTVREVGFDKTQALDPSIPDELLKEITILVTLFKFPKPELAKKLKLVHLVSAGADRLASVPLWKETEIPFTNSSGVHGPQIAEWVILQILSASHKERIMVEWQKKHIWGKGAELGVVRDGVGQRLGVLGYGAIGRQAGRVARALGLDVIAYTAGPRKTPESKKDRGYIVPGTGDPDGLIPSEWYSGLDKASLHTFLKADIDILLVAVPLTPETRHFLAAPEFEILGKKNAFILNIARGPIIQQDDLIAALKKPEAEGGLRGAALDVTDPEPLPADSELWDLKNVAITPHISGLGTLYAQRSFEILERNLTNLENGSKLINVVDRKKGY